MLEMADTLAENSHEYWAKKKSQQLDALGQYHRRCYSSLLGTALSNAAANSLTQYRGIMLSCTCFSSGGAIHTQLLAFSMLTERERNAQKEKAKELLRFLQVNGFRVEG